MLMLTKKKKKSWSSYIISDQADFIARKIIRDKEWHYIMTKESILQEELTILNVYVPDNRASKYMWQKNRTARRNKWIHYYSWRLLRPFISNWQILQAEISKDIFELNDTIYQWDQTDIYKVLHPTTKYTLFSSVHGTFTKTDYNLDYMSK